MRSTQKEKLTTSLLTGTTILMLVTTVLSGGCVAMLFGSSGAGAGSIPDEGTVIVTETPAATLETPVQPAPAITPLKSAAVLEVAPYMTPDPYPILHATRLNETLLTNPVFYGPYEFEKRYTLRGNATGLLVNVVDGPLYIIYEVSPQNDCLKSPDSCRGDKEKSVNRPYLTITVRDNQTQEILATDGYGREFSSDTGNYEIIITETNADGSSTTTTSTPGPRFIKIYREGTFHVTLEGNFLDVDVRIKTGASPADVGYTTGSGTVPAPDEEEEPFF